MLNIAYPFHFDSRGRTAAADPDSHVRDLVEQLLFTSPGERVNRPEFGSGLLRLVHTPNSPELEAALDYSIRASIQRWLGDLIDLQRLEIVRQDSAIYIEVRYIVKRTGQTQAVTLSRSTP